MENCSAVPSTVNEMLFQSHQGLLRFFPVWDMTKDAAFSQLRGYGAFLASAELEQGVVKNVSLYSEKGRPCKVLCPWKTGMTILKNKIAIAGEVQESKEGLIYSFETETGTAYQLLPGNFL